jgi:hypothetical protein
MTQQGQALPGYFISLAFVIHYPHLICRKLSAIRNGSRRIENYSTLKIFQEMDINELVILNLN